MKKYYTLVWLALTGTALAQVPNHGFEQTLTDGTSLKNWGAFYPIPVSINPETGASESNQIFFDNGQSFTFGVADCWTGSLAMYVSNAFNATTNEVIPGFSRLFNDEISETASGWNYGIPVSPTAEVDILGFDCKFSPAGNDVAVARLELFDIDGEAVGTAEIQITESMWDFQYVYAPVARVSNHTAAFMQIGFTIKNPDGQVNWGTSLVVDNVLVNWNMLANQKQQASDIKVYPTVTDARINIDLMHAGPVALQITDLTGKTVQQLHMDNAGQTVAVDVSPLPSGLYLLGIAQDGRTQTTKIIKK